MHKMMGEIIQKCDLLESMILHNIACMAGKTHIQCMRCKGLDKAHSKFTQFQSMRSVSVRSNPYMQKVRGNRTFEVHHIWKNDISLDMDIKACTTPEATSERQLQIPQITPRHMGD